MLQDTDGSAIIFLLWLVWFYWRLWHRLCELRATDEQGSKDGTDGGAVVGGHQTPDEPSADAAKFEASPENGAVEQRDVTTALFEIERRDRSFSVENFLTGACAAFEVITAAFANGDRAMLKNSLSHDVYEVFVTAINERECRGERVETSFVRVSRPEVVDVRLDDDETQVSVRFVSELFSVTRNATGAIVGGNPGECTKAVDIWTFAKHPTSRDPVWKLVASNPA